MKTRYMVIVFLGCLIFSLGFLWPPNPTQAQQAQNVLPAFNITKGAIVMWSGDASTIPNGWLLCDGTKGTPDLRDRFILGIQLGQNPGETGGSDVVQLSESNLPTHNHTFATDYKGAHAHVYSDGWMDYQDVWLGIWASIDLAWAGNDWEDEYVSGGAHVHNGTTEYEGYGDLIDNRPSYYRLAFIMNSQEGAHSYPIPKGAIAIWSGEAATIPYGWQVCDSINGTPDLRDRFILGGETAGEMSGSNTVQLTTATMPEHGHSFTTDSSGWHQHKLEDHYRQLISYYTDMNYQPYVSSAPLTTGWASGEIAYSGEHNHSCLTDYKGGSLPYDNRPAYYKLAFIMRVL